MEERDEPGIDTQIGNFFFTDTRAPVADGLWTDCRLIAVCHILATFPTIPSRRSTTEPDPRQGEGRKSASLQSNFGSLRCNRRELDIPTPPLLHDEISAKRECLSLVTRFFFDFQNVLLAIDSLLAPAMSCDQLRVTSVTLPLILCHSMKKVNVG